MVTGCFGNILASATAAFRNRFIWLLAVFGNIFASATAAFRNPFIWLLAVFGNIFASATAAFRNPLGAAAGTVKNLPTIGF
jgi:hypothetical protein